MKKWLLIAFSALVFAAGVVVWQYWPVEEQPATLAVIDLVPATPKQMLPGEEFGVKSCRPIDAWAFILLLENDVWIECRLKVITVPEAVNETLQLLRNSTQPTAVLRRKIGNYWVIDLYVTVDGQRVDVVEWLQKRKLVL